MMLLFLNWGLEQWQERVRGGVRERRRDCLFFSLDDKLNGVFLGFGPYE